MRKIVGILVVSMIAMLLLTLAGCEKKGNENSKNQTALSTVTVESSNINPNIKSMPTSDKPSANVPAESVQNGKKEEKISGTDIKRVVTDTTTPILPGPAKSLQLSDINHMKIVTEGEIVNFPNLAAKDPDGDILSYSFTSPLNREGVWQTHIGDVGEYKTIITVSDGTTETRQEILIKVKRINHPPLIFDTGPITITEGDLLSIKPHVEDLDDDTVNITFNWLKKQMPYQTTYEDSGKYGVLIVARDWDSESRLNLVVNILNKDRAPRLNKIPNAAMYDGDTFYLKANATDPDHDPLIFNYGAPLDVEGKYVSKIGEVAKYLVNVTVTDGELQDSRTFVLDIQKGNRPPVLNGATKIHAKEGDEINLNISAEDPEGKPVEVSYTGWMNKPFHKITYRDAGIHRVVVRANDGENEVSQEITITVDNTNRPPVFTKGAFR